MSSVVRNSASGMLMCVAATASIALLFPQSINLQGANGEEVIFIVPGSSDPQVSVSYDPALQIIQSGQEIVFVNVDGLDHQLIVKSEGESIFDTGVLGQNAFIAHTFTENGEYSIECGIHSHKAGGILVTDDIAVFTKPMESRNIDVQLVRSPAYPQTNDEIYYKVTFLDKETGRNKSHVDFTLTFNDTAKNYVDGAGGHTVDGQEFARFTFDREDSFVPAVTVSGIDFVPIEPEVVTFEILVTPEFPAVIAASILVATLGSIVFYMRKINYWSR